MKTFQELVIAFDRNCEKDKRNGRYFGTKRKLKCPMHILFNVYTNAVDSNFHVNFSKRFSLDTKKYPQHGRHFGMGGKIS